MRCCDCEFRRECKEVEPDTVSFKLCDIRIGKLADKLLAEKIEAYEIGKYAFLTESEAEKALKEK